MKKAICIILLIIISGVIFIKEPKAAGFSTERAEVNKQSASAQSNEAIRKSISGKLIRFHVLANSDSAEDQALKLKVRDKVLEYISPKLKKSSSIDESREIIKREDEEIKKIAYNVIQKNGYKYSVSTTLSIENFPVKSYGNITLPQGEYEAYRILIGNAKGQNWWCVMFPPLCFVDITKGEVSKKETEQEMKKVLNDKEYKAVSSSQDNGESVDKAIDNKGNKDIKVRFKIVEIFNSIINKLK